MRQLTSHEKRTIRLAAVFVTAYLVLFYGARTFRRLEKTRSDYALLVTKAEQLKQDFQRYETRSLLVEKLRDSLKVDPRKLSRNAIVAEVSSGIQKAAQMGGVQLGPIRESPGNATANEIASMHLEGMGQVLGIMALLHRLEKLGFPLIIDSVQISADPTKPGMTKVTLHLVILDFEKWKESRNV
jgi:hypothetical protein